MKNGKIQKYEIVVYWDNQDKIFVAEVPELAGCAAHGKTQIEAVQLVKINCFLTKITRFIQNNRNLLLDNS